MHDEQGKLLERMADLMEKLESDRIRREVLEESRIRREKEQEAKEAVAAAAAADPYQAIVKKYQRRRAEQ